MAFAPHLLSRLRTALYLIALAGVILGQSGLVAGPETAGRPAAAGLVVAIDVPVGPAVETLPTLARQAGGLQLIFRPDVLVGESTRAVRGQMTPLAALGRMLAQPPAPPNPSYHPPKRLSP